MTRWGRARETFAKLVGADNSIPAASVSICRLVLVGPGRRVIAARCAYERAGGFGVGRLRVGSVGRTAPAGFASSGRNAVFVDETADDLIAPHAGDIGRSADRRGDRRSLVE